MNEVLIRVAGFSLGALERTWLRLRHRDVFSVLTPLALLVAVTGPLVGPAFMATRDLGTGAMGHRLCIEALSFEHLSAAQVGALATAAKVAPDLVDCQINVVYPLAAIWSLLALGLLLAWGFVSGRLLRERDGFRSIERREIDRDSQAVAAIGVVAAAVAWSQVVVTLYGVLARLLMVPPVDAFTGAWTYVYFPAANLLFLGLVAHFAWPLLRAARRLAD